MDIRVGQGYDSHRFEAGRPLILGGVYIEHPMGLAAHSDGDVILHAVTDAILGAVGAGDIGRLFPDNDPQWKNAHSRVFVLEAMKRASEAGFQMGNVDITIVAEEPKMAPHEKAIVENIAEMVGVAPSRVNLKAKTNESMGYVGRKEGILCMATVLMLGE